MGIVFCSSEHSSQISKTPQKIPTNLSNKKKERENNRNIDRHQQSKKQIQNIKQEMIQKLRSKVKSHQSKIVQSQKTQILSQKLPQQTQNIVFLKFPTKNNVESYQSEKHFARKQLGICALVNHKYNQKKYVIKSLYKSKLKQKVLLQNEKIKQLSKNDLLVKIDQIFQSERLIYVVMEYLPKLDLYCSLKKIQWTQQILKIALAQIVVGIEAIHRQGIIYRVLKPQNVLITNDGHIKLTDYALSKFENQLDDQYNYKWVKQYAAPEVKMGNYDHKADIWTIGALIKQIIESTDQHEYAQKQKFHIEIKHDKNNQLKQLKQSIRPQIKQQENKSNFLFPDFGRQVDEELSERSYGEYSKSQNLNYQQRDTWHFQIDPDESFSHFSLKDTMSDSLKDLISKLLEQDPSKRITIQQIKQHQFFSDIDWQAIRLRQNPPPLKNLDTDHTRYIDWMSSTCMRKSDQYLKKENLCAQVNNKKAQSLHFL